jgi:hypothetical protein
MLQTCSTCLRQRSGSDVSGCFTRLESEKLTRNNGRRPNLSTLEVKTQSAKSPKTKHMVLIQRLGLEIAPNIIEMASGMLSRHGSPVRQDRLAESVRLDH